MLAYIFIHGRMPADPNRFIARPDMNAVDVGAKADNTDPITKSDTIKRVFME